MGCTPCDEYSSQERSEAAQKKLEQFVSSYFAARDEGILRKGMWPYAGAIVSGPGAANCQVGGSLKSIGIICIYVFYFLLSIYLSIYVSIYISMYVSIFLSFYLSIYVCV